MLERSLEMMIAMMGVLKAGGAYVPMDPEYPEDRLALMAEDAEVNLQDSKLLQLYNLTRSAIHRIGFGFDCAGTVFFHGKVSRDLHHFSRWVFLRPPQL